MLLPGHGPRAQPSICRTTLPRACPVWLRAIASRKRASGKVESMTGRTAPRGLVIAILCCYLGMFIPLLDILAGIAIMVMLLIAIIQIQGSINGLAQTAGR